MFGGWKSPLKFWIPALSLTTLLVWSGRHAYCHFFGEMSGHSLGVQRPAEDRLPLVTVVNPVHRAAVRAITLPASVDPFEKATLYAKVVGYLQWIKVDQGDQVKKDEVLAFIQIPEIEDEIRKGQAAVQEAHAAVQRAQADAALKDLTFGRLAGIRKSQPEVISQQEVDVARAQSEVACSDVDLARAKFESALSEVKRLETLRDYTKIRSPYDGVVTARFVDPGALIQSATSSESGSAAIVTVMQIDTVRIKFNIPEPDAPSVDRRSPVEIRLDALPGTVFRGHISRYAVALEPQTRTMKAEIDLRNPSHRIRPGMFGTATLMLTDQGARWFVPAQSVHQDTEGKKYIYIIAGSRVRKLRVETGIDDGKTIQVEGLRGDESVVLTGSDELREGRVVKTVRTPS